MSISTMAAANEVQVHDAWTDGAEAFCIIYTPPWTDLVVGLRRHVGDADNAGEQWNVDDLSPSPESEPNTHPDGVPDPTLFGHTVADGDIGEPRVSTLTILQVDDDDDGVGWWGTLLPALPTP